MKINRHAVCREVLIFQATKFSGIQGIGDISAEFFQIHFVYSPADFFIRGKEYFDLAVKQLRISYQLRCQFHNDGYPGFVICTQ